MSLVPVPDEKTGTSSSAPQEGAPASSASSSSSSQAHRPQHCDQSLQGLLNWVISETAGDGEQVIPKSDDAAQEVAQGMAQERRQFLEKFLGSLSGKDHMSAVKEAMNTLLAGSDASVTEKQDALEVISEEVEDINVAQDFISINGIVPIIGALQHPSPEMQWRAAEVLAHLAQNNPTAQEAIAQDGRVMDLVVSLLSSEEDRVRLKALSALSSMVRGSAPLLDVFLSKPSSLTLALQCLREPASARLQIKALVFLRHLLRSKPELATTTLAQPETLSLIAGALRDDSDDQLWEHGMHLLQQLAQVNNSLLSRLSDTDPAFVAAAQSRRSTILALPEDDKAAHHEELEHMQVLFGQVQL